MPTLPLWLRWIVLVTAGSAVSACTLVERVEPWQRSTLARPDMTFESSPLEARFSRQIYDSKEGASGGAGVGGGGCGCN